MKTKLVKKQVYQGIIINKLKLENFQLLISNLPTKKDKNSLETSINEKKNLILLKLSNIDKKTSQKNKVSKPIIKQNNKKDESKKNFAVGSTDLRLYENQKFITNFLEQDIKNYNSLSFIKLNKFILQAPQNNVNFWFFTINKIKASLMNFFLIPVKTLLKLEKTRSFFEKKDIEIDN